jgi:4-hydroxy-tetrahydrodipicolinate synthase
MSARLDGLIAATVLPMNAQGDPDEAGLRRYMRWIAEQGVAGVAVNVDTGEGPHLTQSEKVRILEVVREELPKSITLVAGLSGPFTRQAVAQARDYKAIGVDALLVFPIPAYLSTPLDPQIPVRYHAAIAQVGLPLILFQLQPALGGVNFDQPTLRQLCGIDGVAAIKEASFDARRYMDTVATVRSLPRPIAMLTGNDNFIYESFLLGADGALIGFGAIMTREQVDLIELAKSHKYEEAGALGRRVQALADVVFAPPVANYRARLKEGLVMLGVLEHAYVREPLPPVSEAERGRLRIALVEAGLLAPPGLARVAS